MNKEELIEREMKKALDIILDLVSQHCLDKDGNLDSNSLSANGNAIRFLADNNIVKIIQDISPRWVIAKFVSANSKEIDGE